MQDPRIDNVIAMLATKGVVCHWDYPGYFAAYCEAGCYVYGPGDDDTWYGHFEPAGHPHGEKVVEAPYLREVPEDSPAIVIAAAIYAAVKGPVPS